MDRDLLDRYLMQGLSLAQIAALVGRHPSTVGYWVQKHGLIANGREKYAPRGGLTREQLEPLVNAGATQEEMATTLDRSVSAVRYWMAEHALEGKARPGPRPLVSPEQIEAAVRNGASETRSFRQALHLARPLFSMTNTVRP